MVKGTSWTDTTDKQLLLAVIQLTAPGTPKWELVAAMMGEGYTAESVRQHFQKLKKAAAGDPSASDSPAATTKAPKSPAAKRTPGKKAKGEATAKSSTKRKGDDKEVDGDDDEESPTKKIKELEEEDGFLT